MSYIAIAVLSVFFGTPLTEADITHGVRGVPQGVLRLPPQSHDDASVEAIRATGTPGTVVLVYIFLLCFVLYYFTNWKLLSQIWQIG